MEKAGKSDVLLFSWKLLLVVLFNLFIFWLLLFKRGFGFNVTIFEAASLLPVLILNKNKSPLFYAKILLAIILSIFFWIRADFLTESLSFITVIILNIVIFQEAITGNLVSASYFFDLPFMSIGKLLVYTIKAFQFLFSWQKYLEKIKIGSRETENFKKVLVGALISVPILAVLILLFASADQSFQALFGSFFDIFKNFFNFNWLNNLNWVFDWVWQFGVFWLYLCLVLPFDEGIKREGTIYVKRIVEKTTVVILVSAIFALFIITQAKTTDYILNGFATGQLNPSTFVREGFYQLVFASIVGMTVFYIVKRELGKRIVTVLLLAEIFLVSLIAGERVWLYQYQYGLTEARVWGFLFLLFVLIVVGGLFLDLFKKVSDKGLWQILLLGFSFTVLLAGLIDVDYTIAVYRPPTINGKVDINYMANNLSYDSIDYWDINLRNISSEPFKNCMEKSKDTCIELLNKYKLQYDLATSINPFLNNLNRGVGSYNMTTHRYDISAICSKKENLLTDNWSIDTHVKVVCDNYGNWMDFVNSYAVILGAILPTTPANTIKDVSIPANDPAFLDSTQGTDPPMSNIQNYPSPTPVPPTPSPFYQ